MSHIVNGACPLDCPDTCAWQIEVEDGKAIRMRGRKDHPYTRGSLCGKVNNYLDAVYAPDRLTTPLRRVGEKGEGRFQAIDWDEAIGLTATALQATIDRYGPVRSVTANKDAGLVLEIAFEGLQRSPRHRSGLAMRFPRIHRIRWDKPSRDADRIETLEAMLPD